jgi:hypothetical protein
MFRGSYWITEVSHSIRNNNITTSFKGTRIPFASLPDPKDSFLSSYRVLFDKITRTAIAKTKEEENSTPTTPSKNEQPYTTSDGKTFLSDMGDSKLAINGEKIILEQGVTAYGVPYNGYNGEKYIQKVTLNGKDYLRAQVITMGGPNYPIKETVSMNIVTRQTDHTIEPNPITWKELSGSTKHFFSTKFDFEIAKPNLIIKGTSKFYNPKDIKNPITMLPIGTGQINVNNITGPINVGPTGIKSGLALSKQLMKDLKVQYGDVVYFEII